MTLVDDLELTAADPNPFKFKQSFNRLKQFVIDNWTQIDYDIDSVTRKKIEIVFETETSLQFRMYEYITLNLEYFMRFYYIWGFVYYFGDKITELYTIDWLEPIVPIVFILGIFLYILVHFRWKKSEQKWDLRRTFEYYAWFECFVPRKEKAYLRQLKKQGEKHVTQT